MQITEKIVLIDCEHSNLVGIIHVPQNVRRKGILIIVGGPQYRVGSHRQFVLAARRFSEAGFPTMRFDYRGMGDSEGNMVNFEQIKPDIEAALDKFISTVPQISEIILWGLCDAASAILFYAHLDTRVSGIVILNPWIRTEESIALAYLKHYYFARILNTDFWNKMVSGHINFRKSFRDFSELIGTTFCSLFKKQLLGRKLKDKSAYNDLANYASSKPLPRKMQAGFELFQGKVLIVLSGEDLTAQEFQDTVNASRKWEKLISRPDVILKSLPEANHTFSSKIWRDQVEEWTLDFLSAFSKKS